MKAGAIQDAFDKQHSEPSMPDAVLIGLAPAEALAYEDFRLAAKRVLQCKIDYDAATKWFGEALKKLSDAATASK